VYPLVPLPFVPLEEVIRTPELEKFGKVRLYPRGVWVG
jgi:hypothetical protein